MFNKLFCREQFDTYPMRIQKGIENGSVLQLIVGQPNPERNQQGNVVSRASGNLKQLSILNRNLKECVRCAQRDIEPNQRNRYDEPEEVVPEDPCKYTVYKSYTLVTFV